MWLSTTGRYNSQMWHAFTFPNWTEFTYLADKDDTVRNQSWCRDVRFGTCIWVTRYQRSQRLRRRRRDHHQLIVVTVELGRLWTHSVVKLTMSVNRDMRTNVCAHTNNF